MTVYGYARYSTRKDQRENKQVEELIKHGVDKENICIEEFTSIEKKRVGLNSLLKKLQQGDTVVVTTLVRLAVNTRQALRLIRDLHTHGIVLDVLTIGSIDWSPEGRLIYKTLMAFAAFEHDLIVSRTKEGRESAKENNPEYKNGRPKKFSEIQMQIAYELRKKNGWTYKRIAKETGISESSLYKAFARFRADEERKELKQK